MDACYPFLPALLRSPFRLRDKLTNSGLRTPKALLLSGTPPPPEISECSGYALLVVPGVWLLVLMIPLSEILEVEISFLEFDNPDI